ncbi:pitrilysin family protein [Geothrix sp. 21YS21S-2]|uniref:M16 family metallopeptidase n=1 Tax=Geothrix sp. 21YS21S-2 TaxID=3068893 RepID=UPI0027B97835|nr:pitrilysin family protein [Geothrix sp. 21YS21S-2]
MTYALRALGRSTLLLAAGALVAQVPQLPRIPFETFTLANGLRVVVHEDHKAPIVAVNIWYHVGSKNEKPGKTGFAHLFEHLMFNGSENQNTDYFKVLEKLGATDMNGTTNSDRTNYFQNVPTSALDTVLWMESDRMGHLLGAIDKARLDEQRGVVQNEKRQGENQPYGKTYEALTKGTYPVGHPYSWTVIGSMDDLNAASLDDVKAWFQAYYGPNNAVLVLAGDIDLKTAKEKAELYFGSFKANPPIDRPKVWVPRMTGERRQVMQDRVPQAMLAMVWNTPELGNVEGEQLSLLTGVLGGGRTSRLYRRLVEKEQLATNVFAYANAQEISGQVSLRIIARPGADLGKIERIAKEELARLVAEGPAPDELARLRARQQSSYIQSLERIGGFGGKSDMLASGLALADDPELRYKSATRMLGYTAADIQAAGRKWLGDGVFILEVHPYVEPKAAAKDADRSKVPAPGAVPALKLPAFQRATLSNGLKVVLAERHEAPVVQLELMLEGGSAADAQLPSGPGTVSTTLAMLDEGTKTRTVKEIREQFELLGATYGAGAGTNQAFVFLGALKANLDASLAVWSDVVMNPVFPATTLERVKKERLAAIAQQKNSPEGLRSRLLGPVLYGSRHPYGSPSSGTEARVAALKQDDLKAYHQAWFKPGGATLLVGGDITMAELLPRLEKNLGVWPKGAAPKVVVPPAPNPAATTLYLVHKPGAIQSAINLVATAAPRSEADEPAVGAMQAVLGGMFTSRVNMNLREDKHWTYGAFAGVMDTRTVRTFYAGASVQTDRTAESVAELEKEMKGILGAVPVTEAELAMAKDNLTLSLPGQYETVRALVGGMQEIVAWNLKDDYFQSYVGRVNQLKAEDLMKAARKIIPAQGRTYIIVGDRTKVEQPLRDLKLGEVKVLDADGNPEVVK